MSEMNGRDGMDLQPGSASLWVARSLSQDAGQRDCFFFFFLHVLQSQLLRGQHVLLHVWPCYHYCIIIEKDWDMQSV